MGRRLELAERERERIMATLHDTQVGAGSRQTLSWTDADCERPISGLGRRDGFAGQLCWCKALEHTHKHTSLHCCHQGRLDEAEQRLAQSAGELATSRALESRLQRRLVGAKTAAEVGRERGPQILCNRPCLNALLQDGRIHASVAPLKAALMPLV
jgi:hypothetical protein